MMKAGNFTDVSFTRFIRLITSPFWALMSRTAASGGSFRIESAITAQSFRLV